MLNVLTVIDVVFNARSKLRGNIADSGCVVVSSYQPQTHTPGRNLDRLTLISNAEITETRNPVAAAWKPYWMGLLAVPILCSISVWNGYPLVYEDTQAYLQRPATVGEALGLPSVWADKAKAKWLSGERSRGNSGEQSKTTAPQIGRSIYYGAFIYALSLIGGLWAIVAAQAAILGTVVALLWYRCCGLRSDLGFVGAIAALTFGTSAGLFANLVMPDFLSGLLILLIGMLFVFWKSFKKIDKIFTSVIALLAVVAHPSHLLLAAAMLSMAILLRLAVPRDWKPRVSNAGLGVGVGIIACGTAAIFAFGIALKSVAGKDPVRLPHLTAHLVSQPLLADFVRENCAGKAPKWAVCAYRGRLPIVWTDFLFAADAQAYGFGAADAAQRRALSKQDTSLMIAVFRNDPVAASAMMISETGKQLGAFSYDDLSPRTKRQFVNKNFPLEIRQDLEKSILWSDDSVFWIASNVQRFFVFFSLPIIFLGYFFHRKYKDNQYNNFVYFSTFVFSGIVFNAFICGVLASPYDRFQARLIWLLPLLAIILTGSLFKNRRSGENNKFGVL